MAIRAVDRPQSALAFASLLTNASPPLVPIPVAARSPWSEALQQLRAALAATLDNRIAGLLNQWPQLQQLLMPGEQQSLADHHARRQALARMRQALRDANEQAVLTMSADAALQLDQMRPSERVAVELTQQEAVGRSESVGGRPGERRRRFGGSLGASAVAGLRR